MLRIDIGVITSWSGAIGNIPSGWQLCDGTNGTPNLRDRFIPATGPTFSVGDFGGSITHNHTFTGDGHSHNAAGGTDIGVIGIKDAVFNPESIVGTTNLENGLPPYYALAYIQFLGT